MPRARVVRALLAVAMLAVAVLALPACDACDGVVGCTQPARVSVGGQIVNRSALGAPVAGVKVEVVRTAGGELADSSASAVTDGQGWWHVAMPARGGAGATVFVDVIVTPPAPQRPYRVTGIPLRTSTVRGDGQVLGRWATRPYITYVGELRDRVSGAPIAGAQVTFVRRGGIEVTPTPVTQVTQATNGDGYFTIDLMPAEYAPLIVDLMVTFPDGRATTIRNVSIMPGYEWIPPLATAESSFRLGLGLEYFGEVIDRGTDEPRAGWFTWRRTGGVGTSPDFLQLPSGTGNRFHFEVRPDAAGDVVGDAFFEPAGTRDTVRFPNFRLATYDSAQTPTFRLRYGERLLYAGRLVDASSNGPIANATLRFRRTGGIALVTDSVRVGTDAAGRFTLAIPTRERGEVTGELTALVGAAEWPASTVRLATFAADTARPLGDVRAAAPR